MHSIGFTTRWMTITVLLGTAACAAPTTDDNEVSPATESASAARPPRADDPFALAGPAETANRPEILPGVQTEVQTQDMWKQFAIVQDGSQASKATGSLEVPILANGEPQYIYGTSKLLLHRYLVRGTCGVTFIAPHYAITAAHCVTSDNVPTRRTTRSPCARTM